MNREIHFRGFHKDSDGKETIYIGGQATGVKRISLNHTHSRILYSTRVLIPTKILIERIMCKN